MGCCGGGHNNHMKDTKVHGENHNHEECRDDGSSRMMIMVGLIALGGLAFYFLR